MKRPWYVEYSRPEIAGGAWIRTRSCYGEKTAVRVARCELEWYPQRGLPASRVRLCNRETGERRLVE